jgi:tripartite-type tricarboxylate transporter receptor subunit TctC
MTLPRRRFLHLAASAAALPGLSHLARADVYPTQPLRLVVGFVAGESTDIIARLLARRLSGRLGQTCGVENLPGVGGNLAAAAVVAAPADGQTLLLCGLNTAVGATLYDRLGFDYRRDIIPVAGIAQAPGVMAVHPSFPAGTAAEFISHARANPGRVVMTSAGIGSASHASGELFRMMTGLAMVHMPHGGDTTAVADMIEGRAQVLFGALPELINHIRAGRLRALAVTSAMRSGLLPDIPPVADTVPGYAARAWFGLATARSTPAAIIDSLNAEINALLADPGMQAALAGCGCTPLAGTAADFAKLVDAETRRWARIIDAAHAGQGASV